MSEAIKEPEPLFVGIKEAAALLGIGRTTVYELCMKGDIPSKTFGTRRVIPRAWLVQQAAECCRPEPLPFKRKTG